MDNEKLLKFYNLTIEAWQLFKKYSVLSGKTGEGWENFTEDIKAIIEKYDTESDDIARSIFVGFLHGLDEAVRINE